MRGAKLAFSGEEEEAKVEEEKFGNAKGCEEEYSCGMKGDIWREGEGEGQVSN